MEHKEQTARASIGHQDSTGVRLTIVDEQGRKHDLAKTHEFTRTMRPGQSLTLTAESDDRWVQAKAERVAREAQTEAGADQGKADAPLPDVAIDANADGQGADAEAADISGLPGAVTTDSGATTRTTRPSRR